MQKAEEYCKKSNHISKGNAKEIVQMFVNMFYASKQFKEFSDSLNYHQLRHKDYYYVMRELEGYLKHFYYDIESLDSTRNYYNNNLQAYALIDNIKYLLQDYYNSSKSKSSLLDLMLISTPVEIDFLEWIDKENIKKGSFLKLDLMPVEVFEELAESFQTETGRNKRDVQKLIREFKSSDPCTFWNKIKNILPYDNKYNQEGIRYISQRYLNNGILYKCVILPLQSDIKEFSTLVHDYWYDLNELSADCLDIYYCYADYGQSGYEVMNQLHYLPKKMHSEVPCIIEMSKTLDYLKRK